jgi:hypothetical protein
LPFLERRFLQFRRASCATLLATRGGREERVASVHPFPPFLATLLLNPGQEFFFSYILPHQQAFGVFFGGYLFGL